MDALELLVTRSSMPRLMEPGPTREQLAIIEAAALRAPDHMQLTPYRFYGYRGDGRQQLSQLFATASKARGDDEVAVHHAAQLPFRAPVLIAAVMQHQPHDKVPWVEQICSAAAAVMAMQQACFAQGLGAIWRTGWLAQDELVRTELGLAEDDELIGFLSVGTPAVPTPVKPAREASGVFQWFDSTSKGESGAD